MSEHFSRAARALEDAFFLKRDRELIEAMRRNEEIAERRRALSEASGITDPQVLDELTQHGLHSDAVASLALVPIVEVVWADGSAHPQERGAVLAALEKHGVAKGSPAHTLVEHWLAQKPPSRLFGLWASYMRALLPQLSEEARLQLKSSVLGQARSVAEAAGGLLGLRRVSIEEQAMLRKIELVLDSANKAG